MREIKFRMFISPDFIGEEKGIIITQEDNEDFLMISNGNGFGLIDPNMCHVDEKHFKLMQYTGLKDKNGVEIYEGDIVEHEMYCNFPGDYYTGDPNSSDGNYKTLGHITITPSKGSTLNGKRVFEPEDGRGIFSSRYNSNPANWGKFSKIIGNIYENPELLEQE